MHHSSHNRKRKGTWNIIFYSQPAFTCSKLTIETLEQGVNDASGWEKEMAVNFELTLSFIVNFEDISHLFLVFLLLTLNM